MSRPHYPSVSARRKLGRAMPIPAWALCVVGGGIAAAFAGGATALGRTGQAPHPFPVLLGLALYGTACASLAGVATTRIDRATLARGAAWGAGLGALGALGVGVHEAFVLPAFIGVAGLPAIVVAAALRLRGRDTLPLFAVSIVFVAAGYMPFAIVLFFFNDLILGLPPEPIAMALVGFGGALSWFRPAVVRVGVAPV